MRTNILPLTCFRAIKMNRCGKGRGPLWAGFAQEQAVEISPGRLWKGRFSSRPCQPPAAAPAGVWPPPAGGRDPTRLRQPRGSLRRPRLLHPPLPIPFPCQARSAQQPRCPSEGPPPARPRPALHSGGAAPAVSRPRFAMAPALPLCALALALLPAALTAQDVPGGKR